MNRRQFVQLGAWATVAVKGGPLCALSPADPRRALALQHVLRHNMAVGALGFPSVMPVFGGMFQPTSGSTQTQLISATGWSAFSSQVQTLAASGWRIASLTALQNMNTTTFYAAMEQGTGAYVLLGTSDPNAFQQAFTSNQSGYRLVDFSITWEQGQLFYAGYWRAASTPPKQTLVRDLSYSALVTQWTSLSTASTSQRMTRVQTYPANDVPLYTALFEPGSGGYALWNDTMVNFPSTIGGKFPNNTLVGLGYDPVDGLITGCWRDKVAGAEFLWDQSWNALSTAAQQLAPQGLILRAISAYPTAPSFDDYFAANLAPFVEGYAYAVGKDGQVVATGFGYSRSTSEKTNPGVAFTADIRSNLASVSKAITGIALEVLVAQYKLSLDQPFAPLIAAQVPNPNSTVKVVTLRNLATMMSGLQPPASLEGPLDGDLWPYLNTLLAQPLAGTPGVTYLYTNDNFTILQGVIEQVSGMDYTAYVTKYVLTPAGVNSTLFNATPDPRATAALSYSGPTDTHAGNYWPALRFVAPGGWISTARELLKVPVSLRGTGVIPAATTTEMLVDGIGWFSLVGNFGTYYHKNGGLTNGGNPAQQVNTCIIRLAEGYDIALVANSHAPADVVNICAGAFDSRGLSTTDSPPAIAAVVHGASFLAKIAPGAFASIIGTGFTDQAAGDWSGAIPANGALPKTLNGISVRVGSVDAYMEYAGPTQVNFLLPSTTPAGMAAVELTTPIGVMTASVEVDAVAPGLFSYYLNGVQYAAALIATSPTALYVAAVGALAGSASRPAAPGDIIELFASGLGATNPAAPDGVVLAKAYPAANLNAILVTIGGQMAGVQFAGLTYAGLFQVNVTVPSGLTGGNQPVVLSVNGVASQANVMLTMLGG